MALPLPALAQQPDGTQPADSTNNGIGIGVKGGLLFSSLSEEGEDEAFKTRNGVIGGLFIGGNRRGVVGVGVDILYARKGAKNPDGGDEKLNMDYLNVPVYARINLGSSNINKGVIGYGVVGVDLNFLLKSKLSTGGEDLTDQFKRADYGLVLGAGVEISRALVEARYMKGLGSIAKHSTDPELKSTAFAVMVGFRFN